MALADELGTNDLEAARWKLTDAVKLSLEPVAPILFAEVVAILVFVRVTEQVRDGEEETDDGVIEQLPEGIGLEDVVGEWVEDPF